MKSDLQMLESPSSLIVGCLDNSNFGIFEACRASESDTKAL